jgi:membrane-associated phospholipid phosphatase
VIPGDEPVPGTGVLTQPEPTVDQIDLEIAQAEEGAAAPLVAGRVPRWLKPLSWFPWTWPPTPQLLIRLGIAVALVGIATLTNRSFLGWGLFVVLAVLLVPAGRARSFMLSFIPYAAVWFIFTALRSLADETLLAKTINTKVPQLERWFFDGQLPSVMLQDRFFDPNHLRWYDYFCTGIHWSYFIIPHLLAIRLWQRDQAKFRQYVWAMTILLSIGLVLYFLVPANPPWMAPEAAPTPAAATVYRIMEPVANQLGGGFYDASYRVVGESNPIAAMPSIHMAVTVLLIFGAGCIGPRWRVAAIVYATLMGYSLVYLGEHYVVDVVAGTLITAYAWYAAGTWAGRAAPAVIQRVATSGAAGSAMGTSV